MYKPLSLKRLFKIEKVLAKNNFVDFSAKGQHPDKRFVHPNFIHASEGDIFQDVWDCSGDNHERSRPGERKNYI